MGQVAEAGINNRKNPIAVGAEAAAAMRALLATAAMCGVSVRALLPGPPNARAGVVRHVAASVSHGKLLSLCYTG